MVEEVFPSWTKKRKRDPLQWSTLENSTKKRKTTSWSSSKWSELQPELLELIIKRLTFVDMLRLKAVCSSWNSTAQSCVALMMNKAPWLMLPSYQENDDLTRCFYSLKDNKVYTIKNAFEDFRGAWCVGSSHGWLVILMDKKIPHLLNPIFGNKSIELPQIPSATSSLIGSNVPCYRVAKAVISSDPSRYNFSVAIIYGMRPSRLAFYNHGDEEWTELNGEHQEYCDIIFHNDQLFALAENGSVEAWDFRKPSPKRSINLQPSAKEVDLRDYTSDERFSTMTYLVESSGEILSVVRCIANYVNHEGKAIHEMDLPNEPCSPCPYRTLQFYVFKLNFAANKWENMESLRNRALFLGGSQSMSLSTGEVPGCEENSIYFTDDSWDAIEWSGHEHEEDAHGGHDMGVYNLEEKVVKQFYQVDKWRIDPPPFWIVPNPG